MQKQGLDARALIGGYQKWTEEARKQGGGETGKPAEGFESTSWSTEKIANEMAV